MLWKYIQNFGVFLAGIKGWIWGVMLLPTFLVFLSGLYENIGLTATLTLATFSFACCIGIAIGIIKILDIFFPSHKPIPVIDVYKNAEKNGWNFKIDDGLQIIDFTKALKQSGLDGNIIFRGRTHTSNFDELARNEPFVNIPKEHWYNYEVDLTHFYQWNKQAQSQQFIEDNFLASSYSMGNDVRDEKQLNYNDLHVIGVNKKWYKNAAHLHKGKQLKLEINRKKKWEEFKDSANI